MNDNIKINFTTMYQFIISNLNNSNLLRSIYLLERYIIALLIKCLCSTLFSTLRKIKSIFLKYPLEMLCSDPGTWQNGLQRCGCGDRLIDPDGTGNAGELSLTFLFCHCWFLWNQSKSHRPDCQTPNLGQLDSSLQRNPSVNSCF